MRKPFALIRRVKFRGLPRLTECHALGIPIAEHHAQAPSLYRDLLRAKRLREAAPRDCPDREEPGHSRDAAGVSYEVLEAHHR